MTTGMKKENASKNNPHVRNDSGIIPSFCISANMASVNPTSWRDAVRITLSVFIIRSKVLFNCSDWTSKPAERKDLRGVLRRKSVMKFMELKSYENAS